MPRSWPRPRDCFCRGSKSVGQGCFAARRQLVRRSRSREYGMLASDVRIGLIGCGQLARNVHLRALATLPGAIVTALAEPDQSNLAEASRLAPRATPYVEARDLLASAEIDAVVICTPNRFHAEYATAALSAGKHVYVEKPLALDLEEGRAVLDAASGQACIAATGFNYRFNP